MNESFFIMKYPRDLEAAIKEKVSPLLEETMEKLWGVTIPKLEADLTDKLLNPQLNIYVPHHISFSKAKKFFKKEFLKRELRLHQGNVSNLAKKLEIDRRSVHRAIKELDIKVREAKETRAALETKDLKERYQEEIVDQTIRGALEQYKEILHPQKMEKFYEGVPTLSRNIAKFLPHPDVPWKEAEREFERQFLVQALQENNWKVGETAAKIGIRAETLHRKIKRLGLRKD